MIPRDKFGRRLYPRIFRRIQSTGKKLMRWLQRIETKAESVFVQAQHSSVFRGLKGNRRMRRRNLFMVATAM